MSSTPVIATEEQPAKTKQRRKTLARSSSHLRQSSRIEQRNDSDDDGRPSWLDAYEETLDERFVFTLKDDPKRQKNKKKGKRSAILSPRSLDKENLSASHQNETPSGESGELTKPRRKHSRSLILRPKRLRDDGPTSASAECLASAPVEVTGVAFTAPSSLPSLPSGPVGPLPPPPPDADSPPRVHLTPELDVTSPPPPPPLPPRDYDSDYALGGAMRGRSRTYAHPAELRKAGFSSASSASFSAFTPQPLIPPEAIPQRPPTGVQGTRSMYELSSTPQMHGLAHSQPVQLSRSDQLELRRVGGAKDLRRWEKKETKQRKEERKKLEKLAKKERKKAEKQQRKEAKRAGGNTSTEATHSAYFVDLSPPSFEKPETRVHRLL